MKFRRTKKRVLFLDHPGENFVHDPAAAGVIGCHGLFSTQRVSCRPLATL